MKKRLLFILFTFAIVSVFCQSETTTSKQAQEATINKNRPGLKRGYKGAFETGFGLGLGRYGVHKIKADIINAYQFNPYASIGIGVGIRYFGEEARSTYIPVFADFRANILDRAIAPYISLGVGYSFGASGEKGGFFTNPTIGVNIKSRGIVSFYAGVGYEMQRMEVMIHPEESYKLPYIARKSSGSINIIIGVHFN